MSLNRRVWFGRTLPAALWCLPFIGCGEAADVASPPADPANPAPDNASGAEQAPPLRAIPALTRPAMDPALRAGYVRARQAEAEPRHHFSRQNRVFQARNDEQDFDLRFEDGNVHLGDKDEQGAPEWNAALRFAGIGRGETRRVPEVSDVHADGARIEYRRDGVNEWYTNGPLGLEQGFVLHAPEPGTGELELDVEVTGDLRPTHDADRQLVLLRDARGQTELEVSDLHVRDATGKVLPSSFDVQNGRIVLRVTDAGATYPIEIDPVVADPESLLLGNPHEGTSLFGITVAVDGSRAVVGAPLARSGAGAAYVFVRTGSGATASWAQEGTQVIPPNDADATQQFGRSVAISGNRIAVGAPRTVAKTQGRAFVFARSGSQWNHEDTLTGEDRTHDNNDDFGTSVAIEGNTACVGAPDGDRLVNPFPPALPGGNVGQVYCFTRSGTDWTGTMLSHSHYAQDFGSSLALMGETLLVGDPTGPSNDAGSVLTVGKVFVFARNSEGGFTEVPNGVIVSPTPTTGASFGYTIALSGVTTAENGNVIIGEPGANTSRGARSGAARVFVRNNSPTWTFQDTLVPSDAVANSAYGAVALAHNTATNRLVAGVSSGTAPSLTLFLRSAAGAWSQQSSLAGGAFAIDMDPVSLLAGVPQAPIFGNFAGVYAIGRGNGDSCSSATECASGYCADGRCCDSACSGGTSDCRACSTAAGGQQNGVCGPLTSAAAADTTCRAAAGSCDIAEKCTSSSTSCPTNRLHPTSRVCRNAAGTCDVAENCDGANPSCPTNRFKSSSTTCRSAAGACDAAERCTGSTADCPTDRLRPAGFECGAASAECMVRACSGTSTSCPAETLRPAGYVCRPSAEPCDWEEVCDGIFPICPPLDLGTCG